MTAKLIPIDQIRTDGDTQPRERIDMFAVQDYAADLRDGAKFPPADVVFDGSAYWLWDGFHRLASHVQAGAEALLCNVTDGTVDDARWLALGANQKHGLRRTNADKRRAVEMALKSRPEMSDRAIADHCGVHHQMVGSVRSALDESSSQPPTRTGRDGRTINTANIGKPSPAPEPPPLLFAADDEDEGEPEIVVEPLRPLTRTTAAKQTPAPQPPPTQAATWPVPDDVETESPEYEPEPEPPEDELEPEQEPESEPESEPKQRAKPQPPMWDDLLKETYRRVVAIQNGDVSFGEMIADWTPERREKTANVLDRFSSTFRGWVNTLRGADDEASNDR